MFSSIFYIFTVSLPVLTFFLSMHVCTISYFLLFIMYCAVKTTIFFAFLCKKLQYPVKVDKHEILY